MNIRSSFFAIPVVLAATALAGACSSSSASGTVDSGGGAPSCTSLGVCCAGTAIPAETVASCKTAAASGSETTCATDLATLTGDGYCGTVTSSNSSGGNSTVMTSSGGNSSIVTASSGANSSGGNSSGATSHSGSTTAGGASCANPPATMPVGFQGPTGIIGSGCTHAEAEGWGGCEANATTDFATDAGINMCLAYIGEPDGNFNSCGSCVEGTDVGIPGNSIPASWGFDITAIVYGTLGDESTLYPVGWELNYGGCVLAVGGSAAKQCGLDIMATTACELATCLPLCAVPEADENNAGAYNDLISCTETADMGACASFITASKTDCAAAEADGGVVDKCNSLFNQIEPPDGGTSSAPGSVWADLIGITCGGVDAGI